MRLHNSISVVSEDGQLVLWHNCQAMLDCKIRKESNDASKVYSIFNVDIFYNFNDIRDCCTNIGSWFYPQLNEPLSTEYINIHPSLSIKMYISVSLRP